MPRPNGPQFEDFDDSAFNCVDCKKNTNEMHEYYMVHDDVWAKSGMEKRGGMLCVGCLEQRLGRTLTKKDFTKYPVNTWYASDRLRNRREN